MTVTEAGSGGGGQGGDGGSMRGGGHGCDGSGKRWRQIWQRWEWEAMEADMVVTRAVCDGGGHGF